MKKIKYLIIYMACFLLLVACGNAKKMPDSITVSTIAEEITLAAGEGLGSNVCYRQKTSPIDAYTMSLWADGAYQECAEFDLLDDYYILYSADNTTYEVSVLKAKTDDDISKLVSLLERRKQTLSLGDKAEYDPNFKKLMEDSVILTEGRFVILLITPNNQAATAAIENLKK